MVRYEFFCPLERCVKERDLGLTVDEGVERMELPRMYRLARCVEVSA